MKIQIIKNRWFIAIMGTLMQLCLGTVYAWSFFQNPVMAANNWSNSQAAWGFSFAIFFLGIAAAWGGINLSKHGPKKLAMTGGALYGISYLISAYAFSIHNIPLFYIGYGLIGGIGLGLGYITPVATVAKWFPDKKGFITGMVVMGFGFGALLMSKVIAPLFISLTNNNIVYVFSFIGILIFAITLPSGFFLVNPPRNYLIAGYDSPESIANEPDSKNSITALQSIFSTKYLLMWIVFFFNINSGIMFISFQSPLLQDLLKKSIDPALYSDPKITVALAASGATLIAFSSLCNGLGRFLWGTISDKIGRIQVFRLIMGTQFFVFIVLMFINNPIIFSILVCYILLCYGGGFGSIPSFVLDVFGAKLMPVVYGVILTAWGFAGITGPQIVAYFKDHHPAQAAKFTFILGAGLLFIGFIITFILNDKKFILLNRSRS